MPELASEAGIARARIARKTRLAVVVCRTLHRPGAVGRGLLVVLSHLLSLATRASRTRPALLESANKLRVLRCFEDPFSVLGRVPEEASLRELVTTAYRRIPDDAVWVTEGLACRFADRRRPGDAPPERRLLDDLPPAARVPAHAGVGLSIAWRRLRELRRDGASTAPRRHLERVVHEAEESALEGSVETVLESLGFAARLLFPDQVPRLAPSLEVADERLPACFWHGLGRALYFTPASFVPRTDSTWRAIRLARSEPPDPEAREHALEGLAWPLLLVNLRTPEVVAGLLRRHGELAEGGPFRRGLEAAVEVWRRTAARPDGLLDLRCFGPGADPPVGGAR